MHVGIMIGPERGRYATKVDRLCADARWADEAGLRSAWIPQVPNDFDAMTAVALAGRETSRIELGTSIVVLQTRHPVALCQQVLSVQAVCEGRFSLGIGPSHHWIVEDMLGLRYERPLALVSSYLDVLDAALRGPGPVDVENEHFRIHNPLDITDITPTPVFLAALGPKMLQLAGSRASGTVLWMADERAIGEHVAPTINAAAEAAGREPPRVVAGVPICVCSSSEVDEAKQRADRVLAEAEISPNYQRLLDHGDARSVGDIVAAGEPEAIRKRLHGFADAGATDLAARVLPIGASRDERIASMERTRAFLADLAAETN